ncbi:LysR family transcriptional regulator [Paenibacillus pinihumi]|uniref:LysR family transcriptional regulator n=1 Tax=Paenibacillus pinihumi TaxID=669462 RepID=UPI000414F63D|nr:LysR family transcriptional regulator [Paenibacillus pinihumi]
MNFEQFEYIAAIARTGSITIAAEQLHVSQAGISKSLSKLEQELGMTLFKRSRLGTVPTDRGKIIIEKVFEILARMEEIRELSMVQSSLTEGEVRFSVGPNFMAVLSKAIIAFKRDYPNVKLEITSKSSEEVIQDLKEDRTDLGLIYLDNHRPEDIKDLQMKTLHVSRMVVCAGRRSSLAMHKSVTPQELLSQPFVNIDGVFSNWFLNDFMDKHGQVNTLFKSNNIELLMRTIAEGAAVGLFIEYAVMNNPFVVSGDIVTIPLVGHEPSTISLGWARLAIKHFSIAQKEFLNYLIREYNSFE